MTEASEEIAASAAASAAASVRLSRELVDCFFLGNGSHLVKHQIGSFNDFVTCMMEQMIESFNPVEVSNTFLPESKCYKYVLSVSITNPTLSKTMITEKDGSTKVMMPNDARLRNLTYAAPLTVDVNVVAKTFVSELGAYATDSKRLTGVSLGRIPIMVRSRFCMLSHQSPEDQRLDECQYDYGGYFIINGNEKVLISQDRIAENRPYVFLNTKASSDSHVVEIRSVTDARCGVPKTLALKYGNRVGTYGHTIKLCMHNIRQDIPVMVMFRALGISSDKAIADLVVHPDDPEAARIVQELQGSMDECNQLRDQNEALRYLASLMVTSSHHNLASPETLARNMLCKDLLPHMGNSLESKAVFMGYMMSRLIRCVIGLNPLDDRDSYINKRLDTPGALIGSLFRQYYGKVIKDMRMLIQKDINTGAWRTTGMLVNVLNKGNVYKMIKATVIETGLKVTNSALTGIIWRERMGGVGGIS
jgi:DNA-directed RNA polymerase II subunit RPB2